MPAEKLPAEKLPAEKLPGEKLPGEKLLAEKLLAEKLVSENEPNNQVGVGGLLVKGSPARGEVHGVGQGEALSSETLNSEEAALAPRLRTGRAGPTMVGDLVWFAVCGLVCVMVGGGLTQWLRGAGEWELWILVGMVSFGVSLPTTFLIHSRWTTEFPAAAPLLATFWRSGSYLLLLLYLDATKWQVDNFAHTALMGCYFPYLVLESSLFIRKVSHHS